MKVKKEKLSASPCREIRGRKISTKEQALDLSLQKLRDELSQCLGGF